MDDEGDGLIDFGDYPRISAAAISHFYILGDGRVRFVFYDLWLCEGRMRKRVCGEATLQLSVFAARLGHFRKAIDAALAAAQPIEHTAVATTH